MSWYLVHKKHTKYIYARISVPGQKPHDLSTRTTNTRTAERVAERYEREALLEGPKVTLEEGLNELVAVQIDKSDSAHTLEITKRCGGHLIGFFGKTRHVHTLQLEETTAYMRHRRKYVADSTIYREMRTLREALTNLRRFKRYDGDPKALWPPSLPQSFPARERWLTQADWRAFYMALFGRWRDHIVVYTFAGLRLSELPKLDRSCVDFDKRVLRAPGTKTAGANRWLPMHAEVEAVLRRRLEGSDAPFALGAMPLAHYKVNIWRAIVKAARKAGLEHVTTNDLRRTFCSWCRQSGIDKWDCADWLGHARGSKMVELVYGKDSPENANKKLDKMPSILLTQRVTREKASKGGSGGTRRTKKANGSAKSP